MSNKTETTRALVICPACQGTGGSTDYWGEYDECPCCQEGEGRCTSGRADEWRRQQAETDAWSDREAAKIRAEEATHAEP